MGDLSVPGVRIRRKPLRSSSAPYGGVGTTRSSRASTTGRWVPPFRRRPSSTESLFGRDRGGPNPASAFPAPEGDHSPSPNHLCGGRNHPRQMLPPICQNGFSIHCRLRIAPASAYGVPTRSARSTAHRPYAGDQIGSGTSASSLPVAGNECRRLLSPQRGIPTRRW